MRAQLKSKQIYYAPFEQRINLKSSATAAAAAATAVVVAGAVAVAVAGKDSIRLSSGGPKINILGQKRLTRESLRLTWPIDRRIANATIACSVQRATFSRATWRPKAACVIYKQRHIWRTFTVDLSRKLRKTI